MGRDYLEKLSLILAVAAIITLVACGIRHFVPVLLEAITTQNQRYGQYGRNELNRKLCVPGLSSIEWGMGQASLCLTIITYCNEKINS